MNIKLLTISRSSWNESNSIGNTFSNFFEGWNKDNIANLYCRSELPANQVCVKYFSITDSQILRSWVNWRHRDVGIAFTLDDKLNVKENTNVIKEDKYIATIEQKREKRIYNIFKIYRFSVFLLLQEVVWLLGRWKTVRLNNFLDEFAPDIIFMPVFQSLYAHRLLWYAQKRTGAKVVLFHADDYVTLHQFSFSPFFWINRLLGRCAIQKSVTLSEFNYCSQHRTDEYQEIFKKTFKVLYKGGNFTREAAVKSTIGSPIKLVFTGNISSGRWKTLARIGECLSIINKNGLKAQLEIYTLSPLTKSMRNHLDDGINILLKGSLDASQVIVAQEMADILVHVESFERKYLLESRLSFSTKIVDYLQKARCILVVGSRECSSIDYIFMNDAGIVAESENEIYEKLRMLVDTPAVIRDYGHKAYACGLKNHQNTEIVKMIETDLHSVMI